MIGTDVAQEKNLKDGFNPIDVHIGSRIRLRRNILHLTQQNLADLLGLTFQQVQKYEKGINRVGAGRLWDISRVLEVPMAFFFDDMDESIVDSNNGGMVISNNIKKRYFAENRRTPGEDPMNKKETLELVRAYYKIPNRSVAKELLNLMVMLSKSNPTESDADADDK